MEKKDEDMERKDEGRMDPAEPDQLEPPSASTDLETPGQQCYPNWETGQTTAAGCLPAGVGSNFGGNTLSLAEITTLLVASNTIFLQASRKSKANEKNKQFDPGGKGREPRPWKAAVLVVFSFSGGNLGHGCAMLVLFAFVCACLFMMYCSYQVIIFPRAEENMGREKKIDEKRNRRASIFLPTNPLKMAKINTSRFDVSQCLGKDTSKVYTVWFMDSLEVS